MSYEINLNNISLMEYKELLKKQNLLAMRRILKERIEERFERFSESGIRNVSDLKESMDNELKVVELADKLEIPIEYLMVLKRELSAIIQKPVLIADFPYISPPTFKRLGECCIQTSKDYYEISEDCTDPIAVNKKTGISVDDAKELCVLCDLIRINGIGPVFSRVLYEAGFRRTTEIAEATAEFIFDKTNGVNKVKAISRAIPEIHEIQICIDFARLLTK